MSKRNIIDGNFIFNVDMAECRRLFRMFKEEFPELITRGMSFEYYDYQEIRVLIPGKGKLIYNPVGTSNGKIRWEERWTEDQKIGKEEKMDYRANMYQTFLSEIDTYQRITGASQVDIARITGVSRRSIIKYLSGVVAPKVSTMKHIRESLGIVD